MFGLYGFIAQSVLQMLIECLPESFGAASGGKWEKMDSLAGVTPVVDGIPLLIVKLAWNCTAP